MGRLGCTHLTGRAGRVGCAQRRVDPRRVASRRSMWPSRCWVGSFIVRAGGRECWLAAAVVVVLLCWLGELGRRSTTAEGLGALSRPVAWRAAARWVGCRLPLNVQRFPPFSSTECSVPDVVRPTAHPCYTCDSFFCTPSRHRVRTDRPGY